MIKTEILLPDENGIDAAADLLKKGEVVAIPTETVYGLAADATNEKAVAGIFEAKGRPQDNPLIVHISDVSDMEKYAQDIPDTAYRLAEKFWPGPLTMVLPKKDIIPMATSGGLDTVGIRLPSNETARRIIERAGVALAAPSANLSGSPSPTSAQHVLDDMNGRIPLIIDGGSCTVGVESTVISFDGEGVRILRPGYVTYEDLRTVTENVVVDKGVTAELEAGVKAASPGMKYKHYSPEADIILVEGDILQFTDYVGENYGDGVYSMIFDDDAIEFPYRYITYGNTDVEQAVEVFDRLREADAIGARRVYVRCPSKCGVGLAVYNRLLRAAGFEVVSL